MKISKVFKQKNLNDYADDNNADLVSRLVNGGGNGKSERITKTALLMTKFNAELCINHV
jgi:predicted chitinase